MVLVICDVHIALVVYGETPGRIQFTGATAQAAPTAQKCPIGCKLAHLVTATVGHEQGIVGINGDARGPVGFALAGMGSTPAAQEVPVFVENRHPVQPFVGHVDVSLCIDDKTRWPDQLAWRTAVAA